MNIEDLKQNWKTLSEELEQNRDDAKLEDLIKSSTKFTLDEVKKFAIKGFIFFTIILILLALDIFLEEPVSQKKISIFYAFLGIGVIGVICDGYGMYLLCKIDVNQHINEVGKQLDKYWSLSMLELKLIVPFVIIYMLIATLIIYDEFPWGHAISGGIGGAIGLLWTWKHAKRVRKCRSEIKRYNNQSYH